MRITKRIWMQLALLFAVTAVAASVMIFNYLRLPNLLFGIGHYRVTVQLPEAAGLYERANVTYLGTPVGKVDSVDLTDTGVDAVLSLRSDVPIPSDLDVEVHSTSAVGEQFVALLPRAGDSAPLANGAVVQADRASVPPAISALLDATNRGLEAIPGDNLRTVIDESYTAVSGLGPDLSRLVRGSTNLASDAWANLGDLTNVVDNVTPVLDSQTDTSDSIQAWATHLADITGQLKNNDAALSGVLTKGSVAANQTQQVLDRLRPTLPIVLANLASVAPVLITYRANLEQLLVLAPQGVAAQQATNVQNATNKSQYAGGTLAFNLNFNLPPPCTTGFLPAQQQRPPSFQDWPERPDGDIYCRIPQDSQFNVRGARNIPCATRPGKRAPTVKMCESDENYVPLNDGFYWKGDPNATQSGQAIPQLPPGTPPAASNSSPPAAVPPPITVATYDPASGTYVGPDGKVYTQSDLNQTAKEEKSWQSMLIPPPGN